MMGGAYNGFFTVSGIGYGTKQLTSFDAALVSAGIGDFNLIKMSSILPGGSKRVEVVNNNHIQLIFGSSGYGSHINTGSLIPVAYAYKSISNRDIINKIPISAAVSISLPYACNECGVIMEHSDVLPEKELVDVLTSMAKESFVNRGRELRDIIIECSSTLVDPLHEKAWTTVFAGVVLCRI